MFNWWGQNEGGRDKTLFVLLTFAHLCLVWFFQYVPSQDGSVHLYNAFVLGTYWGESGVLNREILEINSNIIANWFSHLALMGLLNGVDGSQAQKVLLSFYVVGLPCSFLYALSALRLSFFGPGALRLSFLVFPLIYAVPFHLGFYNFCLSLPVVFVVIGLWLRTFEHLTVKRTAVISLLSLFVAWLHLYPWLMLWCAIGVGELFIFLGLARTDFRVAPNAPPDNGQEFWKPRLVRLGVWMLVALPGLLLFCGYLWHKVGTISWEWKETDGNLFLRFFGYAFLSFQWREIVVVLLLLTLLVVAWISLLLGDKRGHPENEGIRGASLSFMFFLMFGVSLGLYVIMPEELLGGSVVFERISLFAWFALFLGFAALKHNERSSLIVMYGGTIISLCWLASHWQNFSFHQDTINVFGRAMRTLPDSSKYISIKLKFEEEDREILHSYRVDTLLHASAFFAAKKHLVYLSNYEAATDHFPLRFREGLNPYYYLGNYPDGISPARLIDLEKVEALKPDAIVLWGRKIGSWENSEKHQELLSFLNKHYLMQAFTNDVLEVRVYQRRMPDSALTSILGMPNPRL